MCFNGSDLYLLSNADVASHCGTKEHEHFNFTNTVTDELHFTEPNRNYVPILDLGFADLNVILPYTGSVCSWSSVFEIRLLMVQNKQLLKDI